MSRVQGLGSKHFAELRLYCVSHGLGLQKSDCGTCEDVVGVSNRCIGSKLNSFDGPTGYSNYVKPKHHAPQ